MLNYRERRSGFPQKNAAHLRHTRAIPAAVSHTIDHHAGTRLPPKTAETPNLALQKMETSTNAASQR
ncbi:hypothetical protein O181_079469 [Austropuccinia psidii MF-1]|uniref:Uncharacterized protein n=1 Tax=Austropuccinia psidii MF-1 TaxID=1389203 RepID=A0A9Q3II93_9BASI|nr:hypothetical protein [Austropuccinia psidii MF-1]